jgi:multiple sugar transport system ATP-binding protein
VATLYVTHDQTEAMTMGDRVAVMRAGVLQQCDAPRHLYDATREPLRRRVHRLAGDEPLRGLPERRRRLGEAVYRRRSGLKNYRGRKIVVGLRAEDLPIATGAEAPGEVLEADVAAIEALGSEILVHFSLDATRVHGEEKSESEGEALFDAQIAIVGEGVARVEPRASVNLGQKTRFLVYPERLHFFDFETKDAIE